MTQVQAETPARPKQIVTLAALLRFSTLAALIALVVFNMLFTRHFLSMQTLDVNLTQVAAIVIVGVGMTLVIATGGIDLSVGSLMAISGAIAPIIFLNKVVNLGDVHFAVAVSMVVAILLGGAFGWFNGWLITRFRIQPIIGTLVLFIAGRGIAQVMTNGSLQPFKLDAFQWIGLGRVFAIQDVYRGVPIQVIIMIILVAAAAWALKRSLFGRQILAIGGNERAARLSGVPVAQVKRWVYCIHRDQFVQRRQPGRPRHGARRDRRGRGRRHLAQRRPRDGRGHADRRADHPARALHDARQWRARRRRQARQGGAHHRRGLAARAGESLTR